MMLCDATFYGTLAAVRSLGRAGIPVVAVDSKPIALAFWSRYTTRHMRCPPVSDASRFLEWLIQFGRREGRHLLYPTSDELVYLLSAHRDELAKHFVLYQPDLDTAVRVLDKKKLIEAALEVGLDVPQTWFPTTSSEVERAAAEADAPVLIKPRTQAFLTTHLKGSVVPRGPALVRRAYEKFVREQTYSAPIASSMPEVTLPMLQRYHPEAATGIDSISGFRDREGRHLALLGATKVLQRPRTLGIGLCFESAAVRPELAERLRLLLDRIGYYGVFEVEFLHVGDKFYLIDMNPRFFNQLAFDMARGLDLPRLAYAAALGHDAEVARLVAGVPSAAGARAFCNRLGLRVLVGAQRLFGKMSQAEALHWRTWASECEDVVVDATASADDPAPVYADAASQLYGYLRHPRGFLRTIALNL